MANQELSGPAQFRRLLVLNQLLVLPGVYNALFARVMEDAGFPCIYMSGFSVATSVLGRPDLGMLGISDMAKQACHIVSAVKVPVLADANTGYGGIFSVRRTIEEYERVGLAGLHIEDQNLTTKRCGHLAEIEVVAPELMLGRIRAALQARRNDDFFIIARTDARRPLGFEEALRRAKLYAREGVDAVFVEYLKDIDELRRVVDSVKIPVMTAVIDAEGMFSAADMLSAGVRIVLFPISVINTTVAAAEKVAMTLRRHGTTRSLLEQMVNPSSLLRYIRYHEMSEWESQVQVDPTKKS